MAYVLFIIVGVYVLFFTDMPSRHYSFLLWIFLVSITTSSIIGSLGNSAGFSWTLDLIPVEKRGWFVTNNALISTVVGLVFSITAGFALDRWSDATGDKLQGLITLFGMGTIAGLMAVIYITKIPEPEYFGTTELSLKKLFEPFSDTNYRKFLIFCSAWTFAITVPSSYFTMYMLKKEYLGMSYTMVAVFQSIFTVVSIPTMRLAGKFIDKFGSKPVMVFCMRVLPALPLFWIFVTPDRLFMFFFLFMISGFAWTGFNMALSTMQMKLTPRDKSSYYAACHTFVVGVVGIASPLIGWLIADLLAGIKIPFLGWWFHGILILFFISGALRALTILIFRRIEEPEADSEGLMLRVAVKLRGINPLLIIEDFVDYVRHSVFHR